MIAMPAYRPFKIAELVDEAPDVRTFVCRPADGQPVPKFAPGQFFLFRIPSLPPEIKPNFRSYSSLRAHRPDSASFGIKKHGPFTQALFQLGVGAPVELSGPYGLFLLPRPLESPVVFLAGGIGVTPFVCMSEHLTNIRYGKPHLLFYSNWTEEGIAYRKRLDSFAARNPNFCVVHSLTGENIPPSWKGERGFLTAEMLRSHGADFAASHFYVCGPKAFNDAMLDMLAAAGVEKERRHKEAW